MNAPMPPFVERARAAYRAAARQVDPATAARLRAARQTALAAPHAAPAWSRRVLLPAGAFAVLALALVTLWPNMRTPLPAASPVAVGESGEGELPPDPDSTDPALYQDLDFYRWLAASGQGGR